VLVLDGLKDAVAWRKGTRRIYYLDGKTIDFVKECVGGIEFSSV